MILVGNLSIEEIGNRVGVTFPEALVEYMEPRQQHQAENVQPGKWHCFEIPFNLVIGDKITAEEVMQRLQPMAANFKQALSISLTTP